jgi:hypothetical protein
MNRRQLGLLRRAVSRLAVACGIGLVLGTGGLASAGIVVDGLASDWDVSVQNNNLSDYDTRAGSPGRQNIIGSASSTHSRGFGFGGSNVLRYMSEDTEDSNNNYWVGPQWGGQNYDSEFLGGSLLDGDMLSVLIVSGQRPNNGLAYYSPGDVRITTSIGTFGVEVGGNSTNNFGTTYSLDGNGNTVSVTTHSTSAGSIWKTTGSSSWLNDSIAALPDYPVQLNHGNSGVTYVGQSNFVFNKTYGGSSGQHSIIELQFNATVLFGHGVTIQSISWYPSCANDEMVINLNQTTAPEPATLVGLAGLLTATLVGARRRRVVAN